jgi:hypothetical protein
MILVWHAIAYRFNVIGNGQQGTLDDSVDSFITTLISSISKSELVLKTFVQYSITRNLT